MSTSSHKLTNVFFASHLNISLWSPPPYPRWPPSLIWAPPSAGQILLKSLAKKSLQLQYDMITRFDWTIRIFRKTSKILLSIFFLSYVSMRVQNIDIPEKFWKTRKLKSRWSWSQLLGRILKRAEKKTLKSRKVLKYCRIGFFQKVAMILSCFQHLLLWLKDHCDNDNADR